MTTSLIKACLSLSAAIWPFVSVYAGQLLRRVQLVLFAKRVGGRHVLVFMRGIRVAMSVYQLIPGQDCQSSVRLRERDLFSISHVRKRTIYASSPDLLISGLANFQTRSRGTPQGLGNTTYSVVLPLSCIFLKICSVSSLSRAKFSPEHESGIYRR